MKADIQLGVSLSKWQLEASHCCLSRREQDICGVFCLKKIKIVPKYLPEKGENNYFISTLKLFRGYKWKYFVFFTQVFQGNEDKNTPVINIFPRPITARYFRINVVTWQLHISIRFDLLTCWYVAIIFDRLIEVLKILYCTKIEKQTLIDWLIA